jgi:hypothetical protein
MHSATNYDSSNSHSDRLLFVGLELNDTGWTCNAWARSSHRFEDTSGHMADNHHHLEASERWQPDTPFGSAIQAATAVSSSSTSPASATIILDTPIPRPTCQVHAFTAFVIILVAVLAFFETCVRAGVVTTCRSILITSQVTTALFVEIITVLVK